MQSVVADVTPVSIDKWRLTLFVGQQRMLGEGGLTSMAKILHKFLAMILPSVGGTSSGQQGTSSGVAREEPHQ